MWKAYLKLDAKILSLTQESYLWLLDRTGVYVATLCFAVYATNACLSLFFIRSLGLWFWLLFLGIVGFLLGPKYLMQDRAQTEKFNLIAAVLERQWWRHTFNIMFFGSILIDLVLIRPVSSIVDCLFMFYGYLMIVMIRDRDKKPFFEKAPELAMEGSR